MSTGEQAPGGSEATPGLTPEEQASVEKGQQGFSAPGNPLAKPAEGPQRPDGVPEKFWNAETGQINTEALIKSYTELERTRGQQQEQPAAPAETETPAPVAPDGKIEKPEAPETPAPNPLTDAIEAARQEYASASEVSEDTVKKLEEAGIPKEIFDLYLAGVKAQEAATAAATYEVVGGQEQYEAMARWAAEKLSDAELDAFNSALDNAALRENAVRGLYARYTEATPSEGNMIAPNGGAPVEGGDVYQSRDQLIADQKSERYASDAAFRQQVQDKLLRSQRAGFKLTARPLFERQVFSSN